MKAHSAFSALLLFAFSALGFSELTSPRNLTLQTLNTNYILKWDWDQEPGSSRNVTFTAQYLAKYKLRHKYNWTTVCTASSDRHCDFTKANLYYLGMWLLRVRAEKDSLASSWIQTEFCPDSEAIIGPPSAVDVSPVKGLLQVAITDPLTNINTSMKEVVKDMYYYIQYWKDPLEQKPEHLTTTNNLVILPNLESWTWYCVRVRSHQDYYNKISAFSPTSCRQTDGQMPYWQIFLYFILSLAVSFLFVLGLSFCVLKSFKMIKSIFYPSIPLPSHIQEYLCDSPSSDMPCLLTTEFEAELCCNQLDIMASDPVVTDAITEIQILPQDLEADCKSHSRHSSGDSGVYSTEEGSGTSQSAPASGEGEEVKLVKMDQISLCKKVLQNETALR